jgi:hypothetical protein
MKRGEESVEKQMSETSDSATDSDSESSDESGKESTKVSEVINVVAQIATVKSHPSTRVRKKYQMRRREQYPRKAVVSIAGKSQLSQRLESSVS